MLLDKLNSVNLCKNLQSSIADGALIALAGLVVYCVQPAFAPGLYVVSATVILTRFAIKTIDAYSPTRLESTKELAWSISQHYPHVVKIGVLISMVLYRIIANNALAFGVAAGLIHGLVLGRSLATHKATVLEMTSKSTTK